MGFCNEHVGIFRQGLLILLIVLVFAISPLPIPPTLLSRAFFRVVFLVALQLQNTCMYSNSSPVLASPRFNSRLPINETV